MLPKEGAYVISRQGRFEYIHEIRERYLKASRLEKTAILDEFCKVMGLPAATRLLGGHGRPTTLGEERRDNPFVQEILESTP